MKILTLTKFYEPVKGGMETVAKIITESNSKNSYTSDVLCSNTKPLNEKSIFTRSKIFRSARILTLKATSLCPFMPWQLRALIPEYNLIHVQFPDPMAALSLFLTKPSIPFIIHWQSDVIKQKKWLTLFEPLQNWCLENAQAVIVTSREYLNGSNALLPFKSKVKIIPIGIESNNKFIDRKLIQKKKVLAVGRLTEYKGFRHLIEAAKYLSDDYEIKIVGDGELRGLLQKLISDQNLSTRVSLLGSVNEQELKKLYEESELFCLPSIQKSEAFGVVLVEAMSYSLPIVACEIEGSGVPWVNQHNITGINVKPRDSMAIADAIKLVLKDQKSYSTFSKQSFQRFELEFKSDVMMKKIWKVYNNE